MRQVATPPRGGTAAGVTLYVLALACFASMDASTKALVSVLAGRSTAHAVLPVTEVMWARFLFHLVAVVVAMKLAGMRLPLRPRAPRLQVLRSLSLAACNMLFALALVHVPLAEASAINFVAPMVTIALAALWLRERVRWQRWVGVGIGLLGVLVVLRPGGLVPGLGTVHPAGFFALACAGSFAVYQILTRKLAGVDTPQTTIFHTGLWATLLCSIVAPFGWVWPDARGWAVLVLLGVLGGGGHFLLVLAYERAPASLLAPMAYSGMIWSILFGIALFDETPDMATLIGAAVIATGGLLVLGGERGRVAVRS